MVKFDLENIIVDLPASDIKNPTGNRLIAMSALSVAVSLKRIADMQEKAQGRGPRTMSLSADDLHTLKRT